VNLRSLFGREMRWKLVSSASGMVGAMVAEKLMSAGYRAIRSDRGPTSPFDPGDSRFSWSTTLRWAAAGGVGLGVAKVVSARLAAIGWKAATHTLPPGVEESAAV
jgi:Protein of unknown function (DUF4235)